MFVFCTNKFGLPFNYLNIISAFVDTLNFLHVLVEILLWDQNARIREICEKESKEEKCCESIRFRS